MRAERREQHQELVETGPALLLATLLTAAVATRGPGPAAVRVEPRGASLSPSCTASSPLLLAGGVGPHCSAFVDRLLFSHAPVTRWLSSRPPRQGLGCIFSRRHKENWCSVSNTGCALGLGASRRGILPWAAGGGTGSRNHPQGTSGCAAPRVQSESIFPEWSVWSDSSTRGGRSTGSPGRKYFYPAWLS